METKSNLSEATVDGLQKLIRYNIDSCNGFKEAAEDIENPTVAALFREIGLQRSEFANALQQHVAYSGDEPEDDGSVMAAVHRTWINIRSAINGGDPYPVLCEAERGEDYIKGAYEDVLKSTAGSPLNDVLTKQYAKVKQGHDRVRDLRDQFKDN